MSVFITCSHRIVYPSNVETGLHSIDVLCFGVTVQNFVLFCLARVILQSPPPPPCRGPLAPVLAEAPGSPSAADVGCNVEGDPSEEHPALWES